ncbi:MAG: magnesium transporter [Candidatus Nomurabacteria bacterium]|nr:MAG: magnesium transporter [Candidatus Nomurabacteria bacterium]
MTKDLEKMVRKISRDPAERVALLRSLSLGEQSAVFQELSPHVQQTLLSQLRITEIVDIIDHLDPRQAENILPRVKNDKQRLKIIKKIKTEAREKIEFFLRFHPKATMSLISFNYVLLPSKARINEAADAIEEHYHDTGKFPEVLIHDNGQLVGEVPMSTLVRYRNGSTLKKYITPVQTITYQAEVAQVIDILTESKRKKVVVLDNDQSVLGVIYADEALELFGKLPAESLYNVSGVDENERPFDTVWRKFKNRYKWLILNLATAFLAGSMISLFQDTLATLVILAIYIPIVAGMGGNAASQTFAVMLRGITLGTISLRNGMPAIWREVGAGFLNGILIGSIVAVISVVWNNDPLLGVVVGLSMVGAHLIAGFFGAFVPLLLKHLGKDPAATSTIFISTATDVFGLFILLGLGTMILL